MMSKDDSITKSDARFLFVLCLLVTLFLMALTAYWVDDTFIERAIQPTTVQYVLLSVSSSLTTLASWFTWLTLREWRRF